MKVPFVDLHAQYLSIKPAIDSAIAAVIAESAYVRSHFVDTFERQWAEMAESRHCVSCGNGTDALYIAMRGLRVSPGDEVITTSHSWIATSETITQAGARVVFCDTEPDGFNIDVAAIEALITPRTVGIIPVHLYGHPADMTQIMSIARRHNLWVIEDCAQAHLARHDGKQVGTFGNAATFSFYPGKNLGAYGDAGSLNCADKHLAEWAALFARHGGKGDHVMEGINSRLDGLQAAILSAKLPHLPTWTKARQKIASQYTEAFRGVGDVQTPKVRLGDEHVYHLYVIKTARRDDLRAHLSAKGVQTVLNYPKALPFYPAYEYLKHRPEDFPQAFKNQHEILSLPIYPEMDPGQQQYVIDAVREFFATPRS